MEHIENKANDRLVLTPHAVKRHSRRLQEEMKQFIIKIQLDKELNNFNLSQSQDMFARILGMKDWHEMNKLLFDNNQPDHMPLVEVNKEDEVQNFINNYDVRNINYLDFIKNICKFETVQTINIQSNTNIIIQYEAKQIGLKVNKKNNLEIKNTIEEIYGESAFQKINSGYDLDLAWEFHITRDKKVRFRVNITGIICDGTIGYSITFWKLKDKATELKTLTSNEKLIEAMNVKSGLVIIGSSSGSGKEDLMYSFLQEKIKQKSLKVGIYQDSPDYIAVDENSISSISFVEIGKNLVDMKAGILNSTRRNLDIVVCGELRSSEDIKLLGSTVNDNDIIGYATVCSSNLYSLVYRLVGGLEKNQEDYLELLESLSLLIHQDVIKDINKKPLYIQSYLEFNEEVKNEIRDMFNSVDFTLDHFRTGIKIIINKHMVTVEDSLQQALREKRLNYDLYNSYKNKLSYKI